MPGRQLPATRLGVPFESQHPDRGVVAGDDAAILVADHHALTYRGDHAAVARLAVQERGPRLVAAPSIAGHM